MSERVLITGIGCISSFGVGHQAYGDALISGVSGIEPITAFDTSSCRSHRAATVRGFDPTAFMPLGGGWGLRMTDPARVLATIERRNRHDGPVTLFVHPWELDADPPRVRLPWTKRFVHYFRLEGFAERLEQIVRGASFAPMGEVLGLQTR